MTTEQKPTVNVSAETAAIAEKLRSQFVFEKTEGKLADASAAYADCLPETVTAEQAAIVHAHDPIYRNGFALAAGEALNQHLVDNPDLDYAQATTAIGLINVDIMVRRDAEVNNGVPKAGEKVSKKQVKGLMAVRQTVSSPEEVSRIKKHSMALGELYL